MRKIAIVVIISVFTYIFLKNENFLLLCAGIAIFIFGMKTMGAGFKSFSGGALEKFLHKSTESTLKSISFGIISTTLVQSGTLIFLIAMSFLSAGLIEIIQALGIVLGSKIGTTTGAWLIAGLGVKVDIARYAMPMIVFGIIFMLQSSEKYKGIGGVLLGIGFVFLGVAYIKDGFEAIGQAFDLSQYSVDGLKGVLIFFAIGIIITVITQSSLATIVLTITAISTGQISYMNALAIVLGANMGTNSTAIISSFGSNADGKRLVFISVLYDVVMCSLAIIFIDKLMLIVDKEATLFGVPLDNYGLKVAIFHTSINVVSVAIMTPFMQKLINMSHKIIKNTKDSLSEYDDVIYLSDSAMQYPETIREVVYKEILHLCKNAADIVCIGIFIKPNDLKSTLSAQEISLVRNEVTDIDFEELYQKRIKLIYGKIINFIIMAQSKEVSKDIVKDLSDLQKATLNIIEALKDVKHLQKNLKRYMNSTNLDIKTEYNLIRENLIEQIRIVEQIFQTTPEDESTTISLLNQLENKSESFDKQANKTLTALIRNQKITPTMGTSLMNDSAYVYNISQKLILSLKLMFIYETKEHKEARKAIMPVDDEGIGEIS